MIRYAGARAVPIRLREEKDFGLDVDELASLITDRTKLIILNSPQNPTGGVLSRADIHRDWPKPSATAISWCFPTKSTAA